MVIASYLLHVVPLDTRSAILGELRRVLRPGGRLGVVTVAPSRTRLGAALLWPIRRAAQRSRGALAGLRPLDPVPELFTAGFRVTSQRRVSRGYASLCVAAIRPR